MTGPANGNLPRYNPAALAQRLLADTRQEAIDEIHRAASQAAVAAKATDIEMLAASAFLLASAMVHRQIEAPALHAAHSAMTRAALHRLTQVEDDAGHA